LRHPILSVRRIGLRATPERDTSLEKEECYVSSEVEQQDDQQREYELVFILQGNLDDEGVRTFNERLNQVITTQAGSVISTEMWGRRTLAYPIGKSFEGHYILERFNLPPVGTEEVERLLRFNESVLRYLLIRNGD
jgi:small subunit ribosomal protein S6